MATKKIPYQYYLRQDKSSNPRKSGKYYAKRFNPTVLGTFRATLSGRGAASAEDYSVQKHVKGIHMRFIPDQTDLDKKTAKTFKNQCSLTCVGYDNDGTIRPLSAYVAPQP